MDAGMGGQPTVEETNRMGCSTPIVPDHPKHFCLISEISEQLQTNSSRSLRPTRPAARWSVAIVMLPFAPRRRSTWARLVFIRSARAVFVIPWRSISWASCHATTRVTASAFATSTISFSRRNVSSLVPQCGFFFFTFFYFLCPLACNF